MLLKFVLEKKIKMFCTPFIRILGGTGTCMLKLKDRYILLRGHTIKALGRFTSPVPPLPLSEKFALMNQKLLLFFLVKELSLCHKLKLSNPHILETCN